MLFDWHSKDCWHRHEDGRSRLAVEGPQLPISHENLLKKLPGMWLKRDERATRVLRIFGSLEQACINEF